MNIHSAELSCVTHSPLTECYLSIYSSSSRYGQAWDSAREKRSPTQLLSSPFSLFLWFIWVLTILTLSVSVHRKVHLHALFLEIYFNIIIEFTFRFQVVSSLQVSQLTCCQNVHLRTCYMYHPSHSPSIRHINNILGTLIAVQSSFAISLLPVQNVPLKASTSFNISSLLWGTSSLPLCLYSYYLITSLFNIVFSICHHIAWSGRMSDA
jgi:hypothetical protein